MNTNKDEALLFASESTIFRIVSIAKIVSWIMLVVYLYSFVESVRPMFAGPMQWPSAVADWLNFFINLVYPLAIGLFYFLVLQGVAQGLNLGLDIFYGQNPEEETEVVVVEEK